MKILNKSYLLLITCLFILSSGFGQNKEESQPNEFPIFEEIYSYLNKQVSFPCDNCQYGIAKKIDGYYLVFKEMEGLEIINTRYFLIWNATTNEFLIPRIWDETISIPEELKRTNNFDHLRWEGTRFDHFHFYGYPEWAEDLRNYLENKKELTLKEHEMLARAYSEEATAYIHPNQYGSNFTFSKQFNDPVYEKISLDRIEMFTEKAEKSLHHYEQIRKINPSYNPVIITDLDLKINYDHHHNYSSMMEVKEEEIAKKYLDRVKFSNEVIAYAKNILESCAPNSILITYGDTDSYPLWFVQNKLGLHKDILVANASLMQTDWYLTMLKEKYGIQTSLKRDDYSEMKSEWFLMNENEDTLTFELWINDLKKNLTDYQKLESEEKEYSAPLFSRNIKMIIDGKETIITIESQFIGMSDIALLDYMGSNPERPVYTTSHIGFEPFGLYMNLAIRGKVYVLKSEMQENYADEKSDDYLMKLIESLVPLKSETMNFMERNQLLTIYDNIGRMIYYGNEKPRELFVTVGKKFDDEKLISSNDPQLISTYALCLLQINPELNAAFKMKYKEEAVQLIKNINENSPTIEKDIENLQYIFTIYADCFVSLDMPKNSNLSITEKEVLKMIKLKIKHLQNSPRYDRLYWTKNEVDNLADVLNKIKL